MADLHNSRLFWLIKNICCLVRCDIYKEIETLKYNQEHDELIYLSLLRRKILGYFMVNPELQGEYSSEINHIKTTSDLIFPYKKLKTIGDPMARMDFEINMPYVLHNGKRLYFPTQVKTEQASNLYRNFIENECILGGGYREKEPHKYESDTIKVEDGDVLLDIGCAEALFTLEHIEKIKKAYLVESDPYWADALKTTFKPYADKVTIVKKFISDKDTEESITLETLLKNEKTDNVFIKMDIEGYEHLVIKSSIKFLAGKKNAKIACCTYHRHSDFNEISAVLKENGFSVEASDGYMIFPFGGELQPPYFRKGVLRAKSNP
jgi:hypothetical protein